MSSRPTKKPRATPPEFGLTEEEPEAHDAAPERHEDAPASSEEGKAEVAAQKEKAAREGRAAAKERRSKATEEAAPKEVAKIAKVTAGTSSTPRVEPTQDLVLTQSPLAEVLDSAPKKAPATPSGLGQFPLASAGFPELYRQLGTAYEVRFHSPKCM